MPIVSNIRFLLCICLCFVFIATSAKSQFLQDSTILVDLTGVGQYRNSNWNTQWPRGNSWGDRDLRALYGSFGVQFSSGYLGGIAGVDLSTYTNLGYAKGVSEVLEHDFASNKEHNVADLNVILLKAHFIASGMTFDAKIGYVPVDVGVIGYGHTSPLREGRRPAFGEGYTLHKHSYRGAELKLMLDESLELSYALVDRYSPEFSASMNDMMFNNEHIRFIHTAGLKRILTNAGYVDMGLGHGEDFRLNAQAAFLYPVSLTVGTLELRGFTHLGRYMGGSGISNISNEYYLGASATLVYGEVARIKIGHSYTSAKNSGEMNFRLTPWGESDERAFLQTAGTLDYFAWDDQVATQFAATLMLGSVGMQGIELGVNVTRGWGESYELDMHAQYKFPEGTALAGLTAGVYQARVRWNDGLKNEDELKFVLGYNFQFR